MPKQAISVTLQKDNLTWLRGRVNAARCGSVSELLDRLVTEARTGGRVVPHRSVMGTIDIDPSDPFLEHADAVVRSLFERSMGARADPPGRTRRTKGPRKARRRG